MAKDTTDEVEQLHKALVMFIHLATPGPRTDWEQAIDRLDRLAALARQPDPTAAEEVPVPIPVREIIARLEGEAGNTDTDPRWQAATLLRKMEGWEGRTLMCRIDTRPPALSRARGGES